MPPGKEGPSILINGALILLKRGLQEFQAFSKESHRRLDSSDVTTSNSSDETAVPNVETLVTLVAVRPQSITIVSNASIKESYMKFFTGDG